MRSEKTVAIVKSGTSILERRGEPAGKQGGLKNHGIEFPADVRTVPRSRTNPQFNKDSVPAPLRAEYRAV